MDQISPDVANSWAQRRIVPEQDSASDDRRGDTRHMAVLRVGKIMRGEQEELCMIRNISAGGLMAQVQGRYVPADRLRVAVSNNHVLDGVVAWFDGMRMGMAFDERIDVLDFLANEQATLGGRRPRSPRIRVDVLALMRRGADYHRVGVIDIAQGGAKLETDVPLVRDEEVVITLRDLPPITATVRWSDGTHAGIAFHERLGFEPLAEWIAERNEERR